MNKAYKEYRKKNWEDGVLAPHFMTDLKDTISKELKIKKDLSDLFQVSTTKTGRKYFKITNYLNKVREDSGKSVFQPNMDNIDIRYFLKGIVGKLRSGVPEFMDHFQPTVSQLVKNIELTPADYDMVKHTKETVIETINEILDRVLSTH